MNRGSTDVTKQAHDLIAMLIKDPEVNIMSVIAKNPKVTSAWDKSVVITINIQYKIIVTLDFKRFMKWFIIHFF